MNPVYRDRWRPLVWAHIGGKYRQRVTSRFAESLLLEIRVGREDRHNYAAPMARWILLHPELIEKVKANLGQFHRKILSCILAHPRMTPAIRKQLAGHPDLCAYLL
jgi:hypothetical protein